MITFKSINASAVQFKIHRVILWHFAVFLETKRSLLGAITWKSMPDICHLILALSVQM